MGMLRDVRAPVPARAAGPRRPSRGALPPFDRVVEVHGPAVLSFCVGRVGPESAEDCFQEAMLAALRGYHQLRDARAIRPWLLSIAARKAIDAHRARDRAPRPAGEIERADAGDGFAPDEELWERVRALPEKQAQAVTLRYRADLTHGEIARVMRISEPAARRNVFEGLKRLREERQ
jgi:RNA polymerase sigma factor (sigma-70 family)